MSESDFAWIVEHNRELFEKYRGQWIAVHQGAVVGVGSTATEAAEAARSVVPDSDFVLEALDVDADVIYAGL